MFLSELSETEKLMGRAEFEQLFGDVPHTMNDRSLDAGVKHFVWSTLPNVEAISKGKLHVPHFTGKAKVDQIVRGAGFANHTFVIAPFYYQNLIGVLGPQKQPNGSAGWTLPLDPAVRGIHMGDITELGDIVAGAFAHPNQAGHGEYLPLVGDFVSLMKSSIR